MTVLGIVLGLFVWLALGKEGLMLLACVWIIYSLIDKPT